MRAFHVDAKQMRSTPLPQTWQHNIHQILVSVRIDLFIFFIFLLRRSEARAEEFQMDKFTQRKASRRCPVASANSVDAAFLS